MASTAAAPSRAVASASAVVDRVGIDWGTATPTREPPAAVDRAPVATVQVASLQGPSANVVISGTVPPALLNGAATGSSSTLTPVRSPEVTGKNSGEPADAAGCFVMYV